MISAKSLKLNASVINALLLREIITRYGRNNLGILWLIVEPIMFTIGVTAFWNLFKIHKYSNLSIVTFALTGYSCVLLWRNAANRSAKAIEPNKTLLYHRNIQVLDLFISRITLECIGATASFMILTLLFILCKQIDAPKNLGTIILGWSLLTWFSYALGFIVGAISELSELFDRFWHVLTYLVFPLAGVGFMVDWLPRGMQKIVLILPMVHGTEMVRHGFFGESIRTHENIAYFITANLLLTLTGLFLTLISDQKARCE